MHSVLRRAGRRAALLFAGCLAGFAAGPGPAAAQDEPAIEAVPVGEGLWVLYGRGGNIGVSIGDDGVFLIDDQLAPVTDAVLAKLEELGGDGTVNFVLNTHFHGDHIGGNAAMKGRGAVIVAHENARAGMTVETFNEAWEQVREPAPRDAWPVITFSENVTFHLNGEDVHVFHVEPAHTDGDCVVHFRGANVIHCGDIFFHGLYPLIDTGVDGNADGVIAACRRILELANEETVIIPGHGPVTDAAGLRAYAEMLGTITEKVRAGIAAGKSLEEIQGEKPTAPWDAELGGGFIAPDLLVRTIHRGLTRE